MGACRFTSVHSMNILGIRMLHFYFCLAKLRNGTDRLQNSHLDGVSIIVGDFNHANFKPVYAKFDQFVNFATKGNSTLDYTYCNAVNTL